MSEAEKNLIVQAIAGDVNAFEQLIRAYEGKIYGIALKITRNEADAWDVAQEVGIKLYQNIEKFNFQSSFGTWVYRLATNTAIDLYRKNKRKQERETALEQPIETDDGETLVQYQSDQKSPEEVYLQTEQRQMVWACIGRLSEEHRQILIMKHINDYNYEEISQQLGLSIGTVKSRLARARIRLKQEILETNLEIKGT